MDLIKNLGNIALLVAIGAFAVAGLGFWARLIQKLFCIGYGC